MQTYINRNENRFGPFSVGGADQSHEARCLPTSNPHSAAVHGARRLIRTCSLIMLSTLLIGFASAFAQSPSRSDKAKNDWPIPIPYLANWLDNGDNGLLRDEPLQELGKFVDKARQDKTSSGELQRALDDLFGPPTAAEQQMYDQARAANDQTRWNKIQNMSWANRLRTLLPQIEAAAERGEVAANAVLGLWYASKDGPLSCDYHKALKYTEAAAKAGNSAAIACMGDLWVLMGDVTPSEKGTHIKEYYEDATSKGSMAALTTLVPFYMAGGLGFKTLRGQDRIYATDFGWVPPDFKRAYVLARVLCLCQGYPGANAWGAKYLGWIDQELTPEDQLQAENLVNDTFTHLRQSAPQTFRAASAEATATTKK